MRNPERIFFCDNCSTFRPSQENHVRITKDGTIITQDTCVWCHTVQEIEMIDNNKKINTHRIKSKDDNRANS
jgi:RNase P subunit RPR2